MKTKIKYFTMAIVALLMVGVSSCSSDDTPQIDTEETKTVFLKISNEQPATRAEGPAQGVGAVGFNSGHLYFTDANGIIIKYNKIAADAGETGDYTIEGLKNGQTIKNLPGSVSRVYVVGNTDNEIPTKGNISNVQNHAIAVKQQGANVSNVNLYGEGLTFKRVENTNNYTVQVELAPTVARIELSDITATGSITSFKVAGVFIDNFYPDAKVSGALGSKKTEPTALAKDYVSGTGGLARYSNDLLTYTHDWYENGLTGSKVAKPSGDGHVWGYNLFATNEGSTVPRIVIRLTDIKTNIKTDDDTNFTYSDPQFITIRGFKDNDNDNATALGAIKSGHVYTIAANGLVFDETNLTPVPNLKPIDVEVTVSVAKWTTKAVKPIL